MRRDPGKGSRLGGFFEWLLLAITFLADVLFAVVVNDTICVMFAAFVIVLVERSRLPSAPHLFGLAEGANVRHAWADELRAQPGTSP